MKIDIELGKVKVRIPETKTDLPVNVICVGGGDKPKPKKFVVDFETIFETFTTSRYSNQITCEKDGLYLCIAYQRTSTVAIYYTTSEDNVTKIFNGDSHKVFLLNASEGDMCSFQYNDVGYPGLWACYYIGNGITNLESVSVQGIGWNNSYSWSKSTDDTYLYLILPIARAGNSIDYGSTQLSDNILALDKVDHTYNYGSTLKSKVIIGTNPKGTISCGASTSGQPSLIVYKICDTAS